MKSKQFGLVLMPCNYRGCNRLGVLDLDPTVEDFGDFHDFGIFKCGEQILCTEDYLCPLGDDHHYREKHEFLFCGNLCGEHFELFRGENFGEYFHNIAKVDPELFDQTKTERHINQENEK